MANIRLIFLILVVLFCWGCQRENSLQREELFKIGVILPFSGKSCEAGSEFRSGVELALDIVNQEFDLPLPMAPGKGLTRHGGVKLQAIYRDSKLDPIIAAKSAEELFLNAQVKVLMGGYTSAESMAMSEQSEILRIPFLSCTATASRLTQRGLQWFFRITPDDTYYVHEFFQFLKKNTGHPGSAACRLVLVYENGPYGNGVVQVARKLAKKFGYEIVAEIPFNAKETSLEKVLANNRSFFRPEVMILQASYEKDTVASLQAYTAMGIRPAAVLATNSGLFSPEFFKTLGPKAEHLLSQGVWSQDVSTKKPLAAAVNDLFKKRYGCDFTGNSARSFTGLLVLADALNRATALTPQAIREALLTTDISGEQLIVPWPGIKFEPMTGQNIFSGGFIVQIQQGETRAVWPPDIATSRVVWPIADPPGLEAQP